ncbi:MAG: efflux RND transporter permease subunit [Planctomycetes bacterium]|nr:efflux RND transporter permease subunit [Planctomycetota bacterium]
MKKGPLAWFASNHVASNLLMVLILVGGGFSLVNMKIEVFPDISIDMVTITVPYLGASPSEVEEGVCLRVEEAIAGVEGIKRIRSTAFEGAGTVTAEIEEYADSRKALEEIKSAVDRIITFPVETEKPIVTEITTRNQVLQVVVYGDASERTLKSLAEQMRDDLTAMDSISQVDVTGIRKYEISIEVSEENLRKYGLSFSQVADAVGRSSLDLPGGSIKTRGGEILIRTKGQMYTGGEFEDIIVLTRRDGTNLRLSDIADIYDDFEDTDIATRFDGQPAAILLVWRLGDQDVLDITRDVKQYLAKTEASLPEGISVATWFDNSLVLKSRMDLLKRNAMLGLFFVFITLSLFLDLRLAFWTTMGIPISFMGAFWLMPYFDTSINMISLFAFILSLGIVVDDAVVVGENIFAYRQKGMGHIDAAILGVKEMTSPVIMAVLTTVFAFMPLLYVAGILGKFIRVIPIVVISVLAFSLVEALCILPAHLSGSRLTGAEKKHPGPIARFQYYIRKKVNDFIYGRFVRIVDKVVEFRYVTIAIGIVILMTTVGFVKSGAIKFVMWPKIDADNVWATLQMPQGTSIEQTRSVVEIIETAAIQARDEIDARSPEGAPSIFKHMATTLGSATGPGGGPQGPSSTSGSHIAEINVELLSGEERFISSSEVANKWRQIIGEIPGISSLVFTSTLMKAGEPINIEMSHRDFDKLISAVDDLKKTLTEYAGVIDIDDSFVPGKLEIKLAIKDRARTLGLTLADLGRQVRQGFYGAEVQRVQRGRDDIRVMVRYPKEQRKSLADIENMRIRLADGTEVPFSEVADVDLGRGYANIHRADRRRVVNVTADIDNEVANANEVNANLFATVLPELQAKYPGLVFGLEGEQREQRDTKKSLGSSVLIALFAIFGLLAVQFRSYSQPSIIMSAIPFGLVGTIIGHIIMGYYLTISRFFATGVWEKVPFDLSMMSVFGIVALTGVVVNDSLIMIDLINRERAEGIELHQVIIDSATRRFRPIMLTTLTTFFGLVPMILEKSLQARFLIPMAVSLAFGIVFATMITLLLVPSLYLILEDVKSLGGRFRNKDTEMIQDDA